MGHPSVGITTTFGHLYLNGILSRALASTPLGQKIEVPFSCAFQALSSDSPSQKAEQKSTALCSLAGQPL